MFWRKRKSSDFAAEINAHLELETERLKEQGLSEEEARRAARRAFGNVTRAEERFYESGRWLWWDHIVKDLRFGLRRLRKNPGFTIVAVLTLALGIGANTAMFTVVNTVLLHPLPYPDSGRIVNIERRDGGSATTMMFTYWQQQSSLFEDLTAYDVNGTGLNLTSGERPELVQGIHVSRNYFRLFGVNPVLGRTFTAGEDEPGGARVALMSYGLWQRRFDGTPSVLGKSIILGGAPYTVIGILSPKFQSYPPVDVWMPLQADPSSTNQAHTLSVSGRLPSDKTLAEANSRMSVIGKNYVQVHPEQLGNDDNIRVAPMQQEMTGDVRPALLILLGAVGLVLLIACANVANLLLARAAGQQKEVALRLAIGAGRGRIVWQFLTESLLLSLAGGGLGLVLGSWGVRALLALTPGDLPRVEEMGAIPGLNPWVATFTVLLSLATGVLFGLFPSIQMSRADITTMLKESDGRAGTGLRHKRARSVLVVAEVAIAVILLCGAVLLIRSFSALHNVDPGFDSRNLLTLKVSLAGPRFANAGAVERIARQMVPRVERMPGVEAAAMVNNLPFEGGVDMIFNIPRRPPLAGFKFTGDVQWRFVSQHYFAALQIPLRSGRLFQEQEPVRTVIINQAMARKFWPDANPVGQEILIGAGLGPEFNEGSVEIIGVVGNVRESGLDNDPPPVMYQLHSQVPDGAVKLVYGLEPANVIVRTKPGIAPLSVSQPVQEALLAGDTQLPATKVRTMDSLSLTSTARRNFTLLLLGFFAAIALLLATVGIYGVISYGVEQRKHEIGIRMALGAKSASVVRLVMGQGLALTLVGVAVGLSGAFVLTCLLANMLYGVRPTDPRTFIVVPLVLASTALFACYLPARRATKVDPMVALRHE